MDEKIILASGSPRRKEILQQVGIDFEVLVSDVEEIVETSAPEAVVKALSKQKAGAARERYQRDICTGRRTRERVIFLAADTVVSCDGDILGKPSDESEAFAMLDRLQGNSHEVYTGVTLLAWEVQTGREEYVTFAESTRVKVRQMTSGQIRDYIATGEPMDKAGAYGIQGGFAAYITGIEGDYYNVVGLPVSRVCEELEKLVPARERR